MNRAPRWTPAVMAELMAMPVGPREERLRSWGMTARNARAWSERMEFYRGAA